MTPTISVLNDKKKALATYTLPSKSILMKNNNNKVSKGEFIARVPVEGTKTKDITGGLPRVAELFEARRPKDHAIIAQIDGYVRFGKDYKNKLRLSIEPPEGEGEPIEYLVPVSYTHLTLPTIDRV